MKVVELKGAMVQIGGSNGFSTMNGMTKFRLVNTGSGAATFDVFNTAQYPAGLAYRLIIGIGETVVVTKEADQLTNGSNTLWATPVTELGEA